MSGNEIANVTECQPADQGDFIELIVTVVVSCLNVPLHLVVMIAIFCHWNLVKRSVVNIYAGNVVFGGLVASVWTLYTSAREIPTRNAVGHIKEMDGKSDRWEMAVQAIHLNIVLVTAGSIGLLINAMRSIQFRVHKTVGGVANSSTNVACEAKKPCSKRERIRTSHKKNPKRWAAFYITMTWFLPILITIFSTVFGTCEYECRCSDFHLLSSDEENCVEYTGGVCSHLLPPLNRATMIVAVALYIVYILILTLSLLKTKHDLQKIAKRRCDSVRTLKEEKAKERKSLDVEAGNEPSDEIKHMVDDKEKDTSESDDRNGARKESETRRSIAVKFNNGKACRKMSGSIFLNSLQKNFKLLFIVFLVYILGSIPLIVLALIDAVGRLPVIENNNLSIAIGILPFIGHAVCTILIAIYLSGIRSAVTSFVVALTKCLR